MSSEVKNNIQSEMKEMKERLDTLTASLEENKDEGQYVVEETYKDEHKLTIFRERLRYQFNTCATFSLRKLANLIERLVGAIFLLGDL